jgi:hypothetical protein
MRQFCGCILLLLATLVLCLAAPQAQVESSNINKILKSFPGYHLLTLQERNSDAREFIIRHFPKDNPSVVQADFNGDGHPDFALLLKDGKPGTAKFVILFCSRDAICKNVFEVDIPNSGEVYIRPKPIRSQVSQTDAIETDNHPPAVTLSSTGIELTYLGQAKVVYYWNRRDKKIEAVQTEE